eukprot:COSAG02_NODE_11796_length_1652_cov_1.204633_2_plen_113_part_00
MVVVFLKFIKAHIQSIGVHSKGVYSVWLLHHHLETKKSFSGPLQFCDKLRGNGAYHYPSNCSCDSPQLVSLAVITCWAIWRMRQSTVRVHDELCVGCILRPLLTDVLVQYLK